MGEVVSWTSVVDVNMYIPPSTAKGTKTDVPRFPSHKKPKNAVIIFELLQTARTRKKNSSEVAGIANTNEDAMTYKKLWQSATGAT